MSRHHRNRHSPNGGFTLIETLASLLIFTVVTIGLVPLILGSLRGTNLARSTTIGRNVASKAMERMRGLPFYVAYSTQSRKVDVLDYYFPRASGSGFDASENTYTVTCTGPGSGACPDSLPVGYTLEFRSAFVDRSGSPGSPANPETYPVATPSGSYAWDSPGNDGPQSQLLRVEVTARWSLLGQARSVNLTTLFSDRPFGGLQAQSSAVSTYAVRVLTGFVEGSGSIEEDVIALGGIAQAEAAARRLSDSSQTMRAAQLRLVDATPAGEVDLVDPPISGAVADVAAPPQANATSSSAPAATLNSLNFGDVAGIRATGTSSVQASAGAGTPTASGAWSFLPGTNTELDFWVDNPRAASVYRLGAEKLLSLRTRGSNTLRGTTSAQVNAAGGGAQASTTAAFNDLRLFPTSFISDTSYGRAVVAVDGFQAETRCLANTTGASASATYSATVRYWVDSSEDDIPSGSYVSVVLNVSSATRVPNALRALRQSWTTSPSSVPLVFDSTEDAEDVYLFPVSHTPATDGHSHDHAGYLTDWSSDGNLVTSMLQGGRIVSSDIDNAIVLITSPTTPTVPQTAFTVSVGNIGCTAEERR